MRGVYNLRDASPVSGGCLLDRARSGSPSGLAAGQDREVEEVGAETAAGLRRHVIVEERRQTPLARKGFRDAAARASARRPRSDRRARALWPAPSRSGPPGPPPPGDPTSLKPTIPFRCGSGRAHDLGSPDSMCSGCPRPRSRLRPPRWALRSRATRYGRRIQSCPSDRARGGSLWL